MYDHWEMFMLDTGSLVLVSCCCCMQYMQSSNDFIIHAYNYMCIIVI